METTQTIEVELPSRIKIKKALRRAGWVSFTISMLVFFTFAKLPDDRIKNFINGTLANTFAQQGIGFSNSSSALSLFLTPSYILRDVKLSFPPPQPLVSFDEMRIKPALFSALLLRAGGDIELIQKKNSTVNLSAWIRGNTTSVDFSAKSLDLTALGLVPILTAAYGGIKAGGTLSGNGNLTGDFSRPNTLNGQFNLSIGKLVIDQQTIILINFPRASISEAKIAGSIDKSKLTIKSLALGRAGTDDDIIGNITGDILLGQTWDASTVSLQVTFSLSKTILNSFVFLDSLMGGSKQADGSYRFKLTGPLTAAVMEPI